MASEFWKGKRVLVTGGAGFIGSHVAEALLDAAAIVTIASRFRTRGFRLVEHLKGKALFAQGDLTDAEHAAACTRGQDAVLHFASKITGLRYNSAHPADMLMSNAILDLRVLDAAALSSVPLVLYISGALVYDVDVPVPTREEEPVSGIPTEDCKGAVWAKRIGETAVQYLIEERAMKIAVARLANVYGPRDDFRRETAHLIGAVVRTVAEGRAPEIWGDGSQTRSYLYVSDAVRALLLLAELAQNKGPVNICSEHEHSVRDIVDCVIRASGDRVEPVYRPGPRGTTRRRLDTAKLRALTGFTETVGLGEGIGKTVEWFRENQGWLAA